MKHSVKYFLGMGVFALGAIFPIVGKKHHTGTSETFIVSTIADSGKGSLRQAINCINEQHGQRFSTIEFNIPSSQSSTCDGKTCYIIQPGSSTNGLPLPAIQNPVKIKGANSDGGVITLDGKFATQTVIPEVGAPTGLALIGSASGSSIKNLTFVHFGTSLFLNNVEDITISCSSFLAGVVNQSSIFGIDVSNFEVKKSTFNTTATDTNGIFLTNPTGKVLVFASVFDGFSNETSTSNGNGVYILLNNNAVLDVLTIKGTAFNNISSLFSNIGGNGIFVDFEGAGGTLRSLDISETTFNNFTGVMGTFNKGGSGLFAFLNAEGSTLNECNVNKASLSNFNNNANGLFCVWNAPNTKMDDYVVKCSSFINFSNQSSAVLASHTSPDTLLTNYSVKASTFTNFSNADIANPGANGVFLFQQFLTNTVKKYNVSDCVFKNINGHSQFVQAIAAGLLAHLNVVDCTFSNITNSLGIVTFTTAGAEISNTNVSGCTFNDTTDTGIATVFVLEGGSMVNTHVLNNKFNQLSGGASGVVAFIFNPNSTYGNLAISKNIFEGISGSSVGVATGFFASGMVTDLSILRNVFSNIADTSIGISAPFGSAIVPSANIFNNSFSGFNLPANHAGYAASITVSTGTTCLNFKGNDATRASAPDPYLFTQSDGGVFNRAADSDSAHNVPQNPGIIDTVGAVGAPGSC